LTHKTHTVLSTVTQWRFYDGGGERGRPCPQNLRLFIFSVHSHQTNVYRCAPCAQTSI